MNPTYNLSSWMEVIYVREQQTLGRNAIRWAKTHNSKNQYDEKLEPAVREIRKADTAIKKFFNENEDIPAIVYDMDEINYRLASGTVGIQHATNEIIEESELPMMLIVYAVIFLLVFGTYMDWRATICCTVPLTFATMLGYAFMDIMQIGLKVSTLPVMVLAVGIGVDYAFYIYNRLQTYLKEGMEISQAFEQTFANTGAALPVEPGKEPKDLFKLLPKVSVRESPIIPSDNINVSKAPESKDP